MAEEKEWFEEDGSYVIMNDDGVTRIRCDSDTPTEIMDEEEQFEVIEILTEPVTPAPAKHAPFTPPTAMEQFFSRNPLPKPSHLDRTRKLPDLHLGQTPKSHHSKKQALDKSYVNTRIVDFPNEYLREEPKGFLFCGCCMVDVSTKKATCKTHICSQSHIRHREIATEKKIKSASIYQYIVNAEERRAGDTLSTENQVKRMELAGIIMMAGVKFNKLDDPVSGLGEYLAAHLGKFHVEALKNMIPDHNKLEMGRVKEELAKSKTPIAFVVDGTTDVCEVTALLIIWFDLAKGKVRQRLIGVTLSQQSMTGEGLAAHVVNKILREFSIDPQRVHAAVRDGASVNTKAVRIMKAMFPLLVDVACSSHAGSNAGKTFACVSAVKFVSSWSMMMTMSNIARALWRNDVGHKAERKSMVRWGAEYTVIRQIVTLWPSVLAIVNHATAFAPEIRTTLRSLLVPDKVTTTRLELALIADAGSVIYDFVYNFEGDGFVGDKMFAAKEAVIVALRAIVEQRINVPNVAAVATQASGADLVMRDRLIAETCVKATRAMEKFTSYWDPDVRNGGHLVNVYSFYNGMRILNPATFRIMGMGDAAVAMVDLLLTIPALALKAGVIRADLLSELPRYFAHAEHFDFEGDVLLFWSQHRNSMPAWYEHVIPEVVLLQPTSAAAERVFAMLTWMFDEDQEAALSDYKQTALMLRYNELKRNHSNE